MGDFSHLKNKKGELIAQPLPQPTLPNLSVDDDFDDTSSLRTRAAPPSTYTQDYYDYKSEYTQDYPPMPAYNQAYSQHPGQPGQQGSYYSQSTTTFVGDEHQKPHMMFDDDQGSTANLAMSAAPFAQPERTGSVPPGPYGSSGMNGSYVADPHDVYQGRAIPNSDYTRRSPQPQGDYVHHQMHMGGGGYGADVQGYPNPIHAPQIPLRSQTYSQENNYNAYDYEGQGHAEQGYHHGYGPNDGGGGYGPHAL